MFLTCDRNMSPSVLNDWEVYVIMNWLYTLWRNEQDLIVAGILDLQAVVREEVDPAYYTHFYVRGRGVITKYFIYILFKYLCK